MAAPPTVLPPQQRAPQSARVVAPRAAPGEQLQVRISELPLAETINDTDQYEVAQAGTSRRMPFARIKEAIEPDLRPFLTGIVGGTGLQVVGAAPIPTVSLASAGLPGTYGDASHIPQIHVDQFGRVVDVTLVQVSLPDVSAFAPLNSPAFTGIPTAPTPAPGNNTTALATTAFVGGEISARTLTLAPLNSPIFTGNPTGPTPPEGDNDTSLATTEFVVRAMAAGAAIVVGTTAPVPARSNQLWWHSVFGQLFLFFDDGDSQQWVPASPAVSNVEIPAGNIAEHAGATVPNGWLLCDGALRNRVSDARLFGVIGAFYGAGDGSTTFALPNLPATDLQLGNKIIKR